MPVTTTQKPKVRQVGLLARVGTVALAAAIAAGSAHAAGTPPSPQAWMNTTCMSLKSLEYDTAAISSTAPWTTEGARRQLLAQLLRVAADTHTFVSTVRTPLPDTPEGASIAAALYRGSVAFSGTLAAGQTAVRRVALSQLVAKATPLTTKLRKQGVALGATFIHLDQRYPSAQLDATIDQTPTCALVHG